MVGVGGIMRPRGDAAESRAPHKKKAKRAMELAALASADVYHQVHGVHCTPTIELKAAEYFMKTGRSSLRLQEVQELALHCVLGNCCVPCPRWAFIAHQPLVTRFIAIFVDDLDATTLACNMRLLPNMSLFAAHASCPLRGGPKLDARTNLWRDDDAMREFMSVRASVLDEQKKMKKTSVAMPQAATAPAQSANDASTAPLSIEHVNRDSCASKLAQLILDADYMQRLNFPGTANPIPEGRVWASSSAAADAAAKRLQIVAIDCEMVITSGGAQELARLTAVGVQGNVLLDMLVVPELPIVNYNTQFSGITKELLRGK
jgi:hypothetical protein